MDDQQQIIKDNELEMQKEDHQFQLQMQQQQHAHENDLKSKDIGWLGKFFGASDNGARNIAITTIILLLLGASIFSIVVYCNNSDDTTTISNLWNKIIPVITLALGYIFGKNND